MTLMSIEPAAPRARIAMGASGLRRCVTVSPWRLCDDGMSPTAASHRNESSLAKVTAADDADETGDIVVRVEAEAGAVIGCVPVADVDPPSNVESGQVVTPQLRQIAPDIEIQIARSGF